jgi:tetratricopeptide (TPR) repeat protein
MGQILVEKMLPNLNKMPLPASKQPTQLGRQTYEVGLDKVDEFKGDPKTLVSALRVIQTGDSQPFVFAGVAYTLLTAAREPNGSYAQIGLDAAMEWLEKAQELAPDVVSINMIEALIYIYSQRYEDARLILDYLWEINPSNYYLYMAEIAFWQRQEQMEETVSWYQKAINASNTVPRKLGLRSALGDCYLEFGLDDKALELYKEAVHFSKGNPWLWHNMSIAYFNKEEYKEAAHCNKQALSLMDFPEAREMETALKSKYATGGLASKLFGR